MNSFVYRVLFKVFSFFVLLVFIILYIVYWYRYDENAWFIQKNVFFSLKFWSDDNYVIYDDKVIYPSNNTINLYALENGCISFNYDSKVYNKCMDHDLYYEDAFVRLDKNEYLDTYDLSKCEDPYYNSFWTRCIWNKCFSENIKNSFYYKGINFIHVWKNLYYCNSKYEVCRSLWEVDWSFVCANEESMVFHWTWFNVYYLK